MKKQFFPGRRHPSSWNLKIAVIAILFLSALTNARAQNNFNVTFRPEANFPVSDFGATKLKGGGGFEVTGTYQFSNHLAAYGGWGYNFFSEKESADASELRFEETGYVFGLQFITSFCKESKMNFVFGAGGIYNHVETSNKDGDLLNDTGHELGWQLESGLSFPIGERWKMIPTVRYRALSVDNTTESTQSKADLNSFSVGVGVSWMLWEKK